MHDEIEVSCRSASIKSCSDGFKVTIKEPIAIDYITNNHILNNIDCIDMIEYLDSMFDHDLLNKTIISKLLNLSKKITEAEYDS